MLVTFLKENSDLPQDFLDSLEEFCDCGAPNQITNSLSELSCSSPFCIHKSVQRLKEMIEDLGILGVGEATCSKFMDRFKVYNPYAIFTYVPDEDGPFYDGCSLEVSNSIYESIQSKRSMLLWEYLKIGKLPGIQDYAISLVEGYTNLVDFYSDVEDGGIAFIQNRLGIVGKKDELSITAVRIYNTLIIFKEELMQCLDYVDIFDVARTLNICISKSVGLPYLNKKDFVAKMNSEFGAIVHLNYLDSVSKDCDFLVWGGDGTTGKVAKALDMINNGNKIRIVTGLELKSILEKMVGDS